MAKLEINGYEFANLNSNIVFLLIFLVYNVAYFGFAFLVWAGFSLFHNGLPFELVLISDVWMRTIFYGVVAMSGFFSYAFVKDLKC